MGLFILSIVMVALGGLLGFVVGRVSGVYRSIGPVPIDPGVVGHEATAGAMLRECADKAPVGVVEERDSARALAKQFAKDAERFKLERDAYESMLRRLRGHVRFALEGTDGKVSNYLRLICEFPLMGGPEDADMPETAADKIDAESTPRAA